MSAKQKVRFIVPFVVGYLVLIGEHAFAGEYQQQLELGRTWLAGQQSADGSWSEAGSARLDATSEVVMALRKSVMTGGEYFKGVSWLENQATRSNHHVAARLEALSPHWDELSHAVDRLKFSQRIAPGELGGWGASSFYTSSLADTSAALSALCQSPQAQGEIQAAIDFIKSKQRVLDNDGWDGSFNEVTDSELTARVLLALQCVAAQDPHP